MFKILDGRDKFYQWDLDRQLIVEDSTIAQVHFCNRTEDCSLICETFVEDGLTLVNVPNILLTTDWCINVYAYAGYTKYEKCFEVVSRTKPSDYIYTETEIRNYEYLAEEIEELKEKGVSANINIVNSGNKGGVAQTPEKEYFTTANPYIDLSDINDIPDGIEVVYGYGEKGEPYMKGVATGALGKASAIFGSKAQATGSRAFAEGSGTIASGAHAHAEGCDTWASGDDAHAEGWGTLASGAQSHAEGTGTMASGKYSHAEGDGTKASGYASHAEGYQTKATSTNAHAEGNNTQATGEHSHAQGFYTIASGLASSATGYETQAKGNHATTMGKGTIASGNFSLARGRYNREDTEDKYADIVGNGEQGFPSNCYTLDWYGNGWYKRTVECGEGLILSSPDGTRYKITVENGGSLKATAI